VFRKILVVCLGNICRSPVGEGLLKNCFNKMGKPEIMVSSAGIAAVVGAPASAHSITVMKARNIDISDHIARQLTHEMMVEHDLILVMEMDQKKHLEQRFSFARGKVHLMGRFQNREISDPYLKPLEAFESMADRMEHCVNDWIKQCWSLEKKAEKSLEKN